MSFFDEIKNIFHGFWRAIILWKIKNRWKITHMWRRWSTTQNFLLTFTDQLWKTPKIRILKKTKQNCCRYCSWDINCKGQSFLSFWAIFCPLTLLTTQKNQNFEKQNCLEILLFCTCVLQMKIIWCMVPGISSATDRIKWKKAWRYHNFTQVYQKSQS